MNKLLLPVAVISSSFYSYITLANDNVQNLTFNQYQDAISDTQGALAGAVNFVQNSIIPSHNGVENDVQPHLTALRKTMVLFAPEHDLNNNRIILSAYNTNDELVYQRLMTTPQELTKIAGQSGYLGVIEKPDQFDRSITDNNTLRKLSDSSYFADVLEDNDRLYVGTRDGNWSGSFILPTGGQFASKIVTFKSNAGYDSTIHYGDASIVLSRGNEFTFYNIDGVWMSESDVELNRIAYSDKAFSAILPADIIEPGLHLSFADGELSSTITHLNIGAASELVINTIDLGMLTSPRESFKFQSDQELQRQYFQQLPISRLTVVEYEPQHFTEVMLPDGRLLTDFDPSDGGYYTGTMRGRIAKVLVSHGINLANYGINSSGGTSESWHPYSSALITAHTARGNYANGVRVHGLSGGNGMVTLLSTTGNEFSHELGHNFGLGHFPGGFNGAVNRPANEVNSTWGWDADNNYFIPNFAKSVTHQTRCYNGQCAESFAGHRFGAGAMSGGAPLYSDQNAYTLHTPFELNRIQQFFESKAVFSPNSESGFVRWDADKKSMEVWRNHLKDDLGLNSTTLSSNSVIQNFNTNALQLFEQNDVVLVNTSNGNWTRTFELPNSDQFEGKIFSLYSRAGYHSDVVYNGKTERVSTNNRRTFQYLQGQWVLTDNETYQELVNKQIEQSPEKQGVPVATIVGYYDPQNQLPSYIYNALHGSHGAVYEDKFSDSACQLTVSTRNGGDKVFNLYTRRLESGNMNKFHINVEQALEPIEAHVTCNGQILASRDLQPPQKELTTNVVTTLNDGNKSSMDKPQGCIVSIETGEEYCLPIGQRSGYVLPSYIVGKPVYVKAPEGVSVMLSDWPNLSYNRLATFSTNTSHSDLKDVKAANGQYLDFSNPKSMRVLGK